MRSLLILLNVLVLVTWVHAPGTLTGYVIDRHGLALPGVDVFAESTAGTVAKAVTDTSGNYELKNLLAGPYSVSARLSGFCDAPHQAARVDDGGTAQVHFVLCPVTEDIDWPTFGIGELWRLADVVARVRISATGRRRTGCPEEDFEHTGTVMEVFRNRTGRAIETRMTFGQEYWRGEPAPYPVGLDMVVFLRSTPLGYRRAAGPQAAIAVAEGETSTILQTVRRLAKTAVNAP